MSVVRLSDMGGFSPYGPHVRVLTNKSLKFGMLNFLKTSSFTHNYCLAYPLQVNISVISTKNHRKIWRLVNSSDHGPGGGIIIRPLT